MKNIFSWVINRLDNIDPRLSELEDMPIETYLPDEVQGEKKW